jgi:hypothetical protein
MPPTRRRDRRRRRDRHPVDDLLPRRISRRLDHTLRRELSKITLNLEVARTGLRRSDRIATMDAVRHIRAASSYIIRESDREQA